MQRARRRTIGYVDFSAIHFWHIQIWRLCLRVRYKCAVKYASDRTHGGARIRFAASLLADLSFINNSNEFWSITLKQSFSEVVQARRLRTRLRTRRLQSEILNIFPLCRFLSYSLLLITVTQRSEIVIFLTPQAIWRLTIISAKSPECAQGMLNLDWTW